MPSTHALRMCLAELIGTFVLCFTVIALVSSTHPLILAIPVAAGLIVGLFVYMIGPLTGCHLNPAVTLGVLSIGKISPKNAGYYVLSQFIGSLAAVLLALYFGIPTTIGFGAASNQIFIAETFGTFMLAFGIASVVYAKTPHDASGIVIGGSLVIGAVIASFGGAAGMLNPAVALALHSLSIVYVLAPLIGSVAGFQLFRFVYDTHQ